MISQHLRSLQPLPTETHIRGIGPSPEPAQAEPHAGAHLHGTNGTHWYIENLVVARVRVGYVRKREVAREHVMCKYLGGITTAGEVCL